MLDRVIALVEADARALGCAEAVGNCRAIVIEGTSADAQIVFLQKINTKVPKLPYTRWRDGFGTPH